MVPSVIVEYAATEINKGGLDALTWKMVHDIHEKSKLVTGVL